MYTTDTYVYMYKGPVVDVVELSNDATNTPTLHANNTQVIRHVVNWLKGDVTHYHHKILCMVIALHANNTQVTFIRLVVN